MYKNLLVPTDGSDCSLAALDHALDLAERYDATLHALYVVDLRVVSGSAPALDTGRLQETLETEGETVTDEIAARAEERDVRVVKAVRNGIPVDEIEEYVADHDVDLVVMGTHGRTGLDRYLLGSVTERVVRTSEVPVLTVRQSSAE